MGEAKIVRSTLISIGILWLTLLSSLAAQKQAVTLDSVLQKMDDAAAHFQTAQADFVFNQYQKVVAETDTQTGTVYYRKSGQEIEMLAEFKEPDRKFVLYKNGKLQVYQPKIEQVMEYSAGANREQLESFLVLGFGGSGQDLKKRFDVSYQGEEKIDNVPTAMLQLIPRDAKTLSNFPQIILWIGLDNGISVQQKLMQTQGDYRLAKYSGINLKAKIGNDVFRLKTTNKTKFVSPRG